MRGIVGIRHAAGILLVLVAGWAWVWLFDRPARGDTIAWRVEVTACRDVRCRVLPGSTRRWDGQFACEPRARLIDRHADLVHSMPAGTSVTARCLPVAGMPGA